MLWEQRLREFVSDWYEQSLSNGDGHSENELFEVEKQLGNRLPAVLSRWYQLIGKRIRPVQDTPVRLSELTSYRSEDDHLAVWIENQSVWTIEAPLESDDPLVRIDDFDPRWHWPGGNLSRVLFAMLVSDTIVGAWGCSQVGSLGSLHSQVIGGYLQVSSREVDDRVRGTLPELPWATNPFFQEPWRGDRDLIVRYNGDGWEWMARTEDAFRRTYSLLNINPPRGPFEVLVKITGLSSDERQLLPSTELREVSRYYQHRVGSLGNVIQVATLKNGDWEVHVETNHPQEVSEKLRDALPRELDAKLFIGYRPQAISRYTVMYP